MGWVDMIDNLWDVDSREQEIFEGRFFFLILRGNNISSLPIQRTTRKNESCNREARVQDSLTRHKGGKSLTLNFLN